MNAIAGLQAYGALLNNSGNQEISLYADNQQQQMHLLKQANKLLNVNFPANATDLRLQQQHGNGFYYQLVMSGYPDKLPTTAIKHGLEIFYSFTNDKGKPINHVALGQIINVVIRARTLDKNNSALPVSITNLLPGGFELVQDSLHPWQYIYSVTRDDRIVFYLTTTPNIKTINYKLRATTPGKFVAAGIYAQSLMNPNNTYAESAASNITVQ